MAAGYELLQIQESNNFVPAQSDTWVNVPIHTVFSDPSDIGIAILRVINTSSSNEIGIGFRHPDETSYISVTNIAVNSQTLIFCGTKYIDSGSPCAIAINKTSSSDNYLIRVLGGIKRDSCSWLIGGQGIENGMYQINVPSTKGWFAINIYSSLSPPPANASFAIIEVRNPQTSIGFRDMEDTTTDSQQLLYSLCHFLVPIKIYGTEDVRCKLYNGNNAISIFVRGWVIKTNPGIYSLNQAVKIPVSSEEQTRSISVLNHVVEGAFVSVKSLNQQPQAFYWTGVNDTAKDLKLTSLITSSIAKCTSQQVVNRAESPETIQFYFNTFAGSALVNQGPYKTIGQSRQGTINIPYGSDVVTGKETYFLSNGVTAGALLKIANIPGFFNIESVVSETELKLTSNVYSPDGKDIVNAQYIIVRDYTENFNFPMIHKKDICWVETINNCLYKIDQTLINPRKQYQVFQPQQKGCFFPMSNSYVYLPHHSIRSKAQKGLCFFDPYKKSLMVCLGNAVSGSPSGASANIVWIQNWGTILTQD